MPHDWNIYKCKTLKFKIEENLGEYATNVIYLSREDALKLEWGISNIYITDQRLIFRIHYQ